jgi:channel protein (hemolysin III family)
MVDAHASLRLLSQSAIYLLIAGSYSPFFLVNLQHLQLGIYLFLAIWALALTGIALATRCGVRKSETIYASDQADREWNGGRAVVFALMGWLALVPRQLVAICLDERGWQLLLAGGIFFGCGVGLYLIGRAQQVTRHRTVLSFWYILVLVACALHWFAIYNFVEPPSEVCVKAAVDGGLQLREGGGSGGGGKGGGGGRDEEALLLSTLTQAIEKAVSGGSDVKTLKDFVIEFGEKGRDAIVSSLKEVLLLIEGGSDRFNESMIVE